MDEYLLKLANRHGVKFTFHYRVTTEDAIASLVAHRLGIAIIPWSEPQLSGYQVNHFSLPDADYNRYIYLTTLKGHDAYGASRRFI